MSEEQEFEDQDSSNPDDGTSDSGDVENEQPQVNWEERAKSAEKALVDLKQAAGVSKVRELKEKLTTPPVVKEQPSSQPDASQLKEELRLEFQGYSEEEIDAAKRLKPGVSLSQAVQDPVVKAAINGIRQSRKVDEALPGASSAAPLYQGKTFQELTSEEKRANYQNVVSKAIDRGRGKGSRSSI